MDKTNFQEIWQIDAGGQIYETSFEEMTQWIAEGSLLPQDKVRRGNLRWIEANKVPSLYGFFNAKEMGIAPPVVSITNAHTTSQTTQTSSTFQTVGQTQFVANNPPIEPEENLMGKIQTRFCLVHIETKPNYFCGTCQNVFCQECPQSYGSVKICPLCGAMCLPIEDVVEKEHQVETLQVAITEGFGFKDFGRALAYPFKFKTSLFFGAMFFMFFSIGQHASSLGGRWLISAAIISGMLANMLTFGILSNTVENMLQHKLNQNFMPSFDDFGLWDDVIQPFFLSIGVYLSSFAA